MGVPLDGRMITSRMQSVSRVGRSVFSQRGWWALRWLAGCCLFLLAADLMATSAWAQTKWPDYPLPNDHSFTRGPGLYFSVWKLIALLVLYLLWVKTTDWVSRDTQQYGFEYAVWTSVAFIPFFVFFFVAALSIPMFALGFGLTLVAYLASIFSYIVMRNRILEPHQRVMTPAHLRFMLSEALGKVGIKMSAERKASHEKGAPVEFRASGDDASQAQANMISARQSIGYVPTKELVANAVDHRAEKIMLDVNADGISSRFQVDGVWHDSDEFDREAGDAILEVLKKLGNTNPEERRKRQEGGFRATYKEHKLKGVLVSQGTKTGERALISFAAEKAVFKELEQLGMRPKMVEQFKALMLSQNGIVIFSSLPGGGLTTTVSVSMGSTDRLLRDFVITVDRQEDYQEIENVDPEYYDSKQGQGPETLLEKLSRKQPDVMIIPMLNSLEVAEAICELGKEEHLIFTAVRAKEAVEALLRVLLLKVPAKSFAPVVKGVLNQRLVRKLCDECKESYEPEPALLKKLGIPAGRVTELFRHPENPDEVCKQCHGIGYFGRTSIFELLIVNDKLREALIKQPKLDVLRQVARASKHRTLQQEGLALVIQGVTSLPELQRVLKQ